MRGLAFTNLCTGLVTQPFHVVAELICLQKPQKIQYQLSLLRFAKVVSEGCGTFFNSMTVLLITMMSIERWVYMTRRSLATVRVAYSILIVVVTCPVPIAVLRLLQVLYGTHELLLNTISFMLLFLCFLATSIAYFKVMRVITHHQEQVQAGQGMVSKFSSYGDKLGKVQEIRVFDPLHCNVILYLLDISCFCWPLSFPTKSL